MSIRILHVIGGMDRGGVETWLMHVLRHTNLEYFQHDFLVHTDKNCAYDEEIKALGGRIIPCPYPHRPVVYAREFKRLLRSYGPYDFVHSHVHFYSGFILRLAHQLGVPGRIAHSHNDTTNLEAKARLPRRLYLAIMKKWIYTYATLGLSCSRPAADALFGYGWERDNRWKILPYGIDLTAFRTKCNYKEIRAKLGIPNDAYVIGHVGRFHEQKNHDFLVDIAIEVSKRESASYFLLVGDGPLRHVIEKKVARFGLKNKFVFTGVRSDVLSLMQGAMNLFLFPSLYEGLGLVLIEAQASGLPCVISDVVPKEAEIVKSLVRRLSLKQPPYVWAEAILESRNFIKNILKEEALAMVEKSQFNILSSVKYLEKIYREKSLNSSLKIYKY